MEAVLSAGGTWDGGGEGGYREGRGGHQGSNQDDREIGV